MYKYVYIKKTGKAIYSGVCIIFDRHRLTLLCTPEDVAFFLCFDLFLSSCLSNSFLLLILFILLSLKTARSLINYVPRSEKSNRS